MNTMVSSLLKTSGSMSTRHWNEDIVRGRMPAVGSIILAIRDAMTRVAHPNQIRGCSWRKMTGLTTPPVQDLHY